MQFTIILTTVLSAVINAQRCSEYIVESGGQDLSFRNYFFSDFRNLAYGPRYPTVANAAHFQERAITVSQAFFNNQRDIWQKQVWGRPSVSRNHPVAMLNDANNVFIDFDPTSKNRDTMLSLTTERLQNGTQIAGELATQFSALYGSIRFESRVTGNTGACGGLFFYEDNTHEHDFEFLTKDGMNYLQLTNQPGNKDGQPVPGAHTNFTLTKPYDQWQTYRLDWSPGMTRYFVDGINIANKTTNVSPIAMKWLMNMWSDGSDEWTGKMNIGDKARLDIRYIVMAFNNPDGSDTAKDGVPCRLQNEMDGQGVTAPVGSRASESHEPIAARSNKIRGGSFAARATQMIAAAVAGRVVGEAMR